MGLVAGGEIYRGEAHKMVIVTSQKYVINWVLG